MSILVQQQCWTSSPDPVHTMHTSFTRTCSTTLMRLSSRVPYLTMVKNYDKNLFNNGVEALLQIQCMLCTYPLQELAQQHCWGCPQESHILQWSKTMTRTCSTTVLKPFSWSSIYYAHILYKSLFNNTVEAVLNSPISYNGQKLWQELVQQRYWNPSPDPKHDMHTTFIILAIFRRILAICNRFWLYLANIWLYLAICCAVSSLLYCDLGYISILSPPGHGRCPAPSSRVAAIEAIALHLGTQIAGWPPNIGWEATDTGSWALKRGSLSQELDVCLGVGFSLAMGEGTLKPKL